jgi:L-iditol 2-dehydrogenase
MNNSRQDMTAIVKMAIGSDSISVISWPRPVPKADQVIVEVHGAGVCGTDLHIAHDAYPNIPPVVMGHEIAGKVVEIGNEVDPKWMGLRVACETHHQVCKCDFCRDGRRNLCKNKTSMGSFVDGGFADYVAVAEELLHVIPEWITDHEAALTEPLGDGSWANRITCRSSRSSNGRYRHSLWLRKRSDANRCSSRTRFRHNARSRAREF